VTDGSFLFARFDDRRRLAGVGDKLQSLDAVSRWDAVDGYFGLAVKLKGSSDADVKYIQALEGLTEAVESRIVSGTTTKPADPELRQAYVLVEADPDRIEQICAGIAKFEDTLSCHRTEGRYGLVVILQSESFDRIDRTIDDRISILDGVLRLKEGRIISSYVK